MLGVARASDRRTGVVRLDPRRARTGQLLVGLPRDAGHALGERVEWCGVQQVEFGAVDPGDSRPAGIVADRCGVHVDVGRTVARSTLAQ